MEEDPAVRGSILDRRDGEGRSTRIALWNRAGDSVYGLAARCRRMVDTSAALLGGPVYHYQSKLTAKEPEVGGAWEWHQDYGYWYYNGCLRARPAVGDGGARQDDARDTYFSWHWIFVINIPIGLLGIVLVTRFIPNMRGDERVPFDVTGFVLAGLGIGGLAFGLTTVGMNYLPAGVVIALIAVGALSIAAYIRHARRTPAPLLDISLFSLATFRASVLGGFIFRIGVGALPFLLPLLLQLGFNMTPFESGLITFSTALGAMSMKAVVPAVLRQFGFRWTLTVNAILSAAFLAACAGFRPGTPVVVMMAGAGDRRVFPLARVHQHQHDCLCGDRQAAYEPRDLAGERRAAALDVDRDRGRRAGGGTDRAVFRPRRHHGRELSARIPAGRRAVGLGGLRLHRARAGCRRRTRQPHAGADGGGGSADGVRPG